MSLEDEQLFPVELVHSVFECTDVIGDFSLFKTRRFELTRFDPLSQIGVHFVSFLKTFQLLRN